MSDHRPPAIFIADALGLDFLNSVATPAGTQVDWITDGEGLMAWLDQAELVPAEVLERLRAEVMPGEMDHVAAQARTLREWFRGFVDARKGRSVRSEDARDLEPLNQLLARDEQFVRVVA
ncbi:ABATE domain-containing protein [Streptomyces sp. S1D4-11]